jgi:Reverse transcriptase (RNA-dependent DNA polymerase)
MATFYSETMSTSNIPDWDSTDPLPPPSTSPAQPLANKLINSNLAHSAHNTLDKRITFSETKRALHQGNANTAPGIDDISAHFLRHLPSNAIQAIYLLFNTSWSSSLLPDPWKQAKSFCLYKNGHTSNPSSYRIISITSILSRTLERIIKTRISTYLESKSFFHGSQNGFRHGRSTIDHILKLQDAIHHAIKARKRLPVVFLDIIKAFDRVPHDLLLLKLYTQAKISGRTWKWIHAFLTGRSFLITQGPHSSIPVPASAGVPQGAVLSPLLFLIYINDLASLTDLNIDLAMFADDIAGWPKSLSTRVPTQNKQLNLWLHHITAWSNTWQLQFSKTKSNLVTFTRKHSPNPFKKLRLQNKPILSKEAYKYLGVTIDRDGSNKSHLAAILQKTRQTAYYISRISNRNSGPSPLIIIKLIKAVLIPQISYGLCILHTPASFLHSINSILSLPLKKTLGLGKHASTLKTLWDCGIPDATSLKEMNTLQFTNRALQKHILSLPPPSPPSLIATKTTPSTFAVKLQQVIAKHSLPPLPTTKKIIRTLCNKTYETNYLSNPAIQPSHKLLKPTSATARYLLVDPRPIVSTRARLRLHVDLSFAHLHRYKLKTLPTCELCGAALGDTTHIILHCPRFALARRRCIQDLQSLQPNELLTLDLVLGYRPSEPPLHLFPSKMTQKQLTLHHDNCLSITANLLKSITSIHFL